MTRDPKKGQSTHHWKACGIWTPGCRRPGRRALRARVAGPHGRAQGRAVLATSWSLQAQVASLPTACSDLSWFYGQARGQWGHWCPLQAPRSESYRRGLCQPFQGPVSTPRPFPDTLVRQGAIFCWVLHDHLPRGGGGAAAGGSTTLLPRGEQDTAVQSPRPPAARKARARAAGKSVSRLELLF